MEDKKCLHVTHGSYFWIFIPSLFLEWLCDHVINIMGYWCYYQDNYDEINTYLPNPDRELDKMKQRKVYVSKTDVDKLKVK